MIYSKADYPHPFPSDYSFIHKSKCPSKTNLYIYIISECKQISERISVRLTWGKNTKYITVRFIIGIGNKICKDNFELENKMYGDIIQLNIYESFANETLFSLYTMKYLNQLCPYAKYYAKADVDSFVFTKKLYNKIKSYKAPNKQFWGAEKGKWKRVNGNQSYKYSSPKKAAEYYNLLFPKKGIHVFSGFLSVFSSDLPSILFNFSLNYPKLLRIDDQYLSWLLYKLNISINNLSSYQISPSKCTISKDVAVIHRITSTDMISYYLYTQNNSI